MLDGADAHLPAQWVGIPLYERSQHPAPHSIAFGSIVGDPRPHRGERVGKALGVPAPIHQRTSQKRVSRSEPLGRRFVSRGKPAVAQPRHPSEPSVRAPASDPQRDAARLDGPPRQLIKPDPGSLQWPSSIPSIRVPRACCGRRLRLPHRRQTGDGLPTAALVASCAPEQKSRNVADRAATRLVVRATSSDAVGSSAAGTAQQRQRGERLPGRLLMR